MQTIIFCTSENEALEPVTTGTPLELLSFCSRKIIDYVLGNLSENGITDCTVITDSVDTKEYIERLIACEVNVDVFLSNEDMSTKDILNTLWNGRDEIMVIQADGIFKLDLGAMIEFHKSKGGLACVYALKANGSDSDYGTTVEFDGQNRFERFYKTLKSDFPSTNYKTAPVYIISVEMLSRLLDENDSNSDKKSLFSWMNFKREHNIYVYTDENCEAGSFKPFYQRIETTEDLLKAAKKTVSEKIFDNGVPIEDGVYSNTPYMFRGVSFIPPLYIGSNVSIGMGCIIGRGTVIEDNAVIGENTDITGSYVGEYSKIGDRIKVQEAIICKNSRIDNGAELEKLAVAGESSTVLENSIISEGVKLWSGKTLAKNTRLKTNLRYGSKPDFSFNEEGSDKLISPVQAASLGCAIGSALDNHSSVLICCESVGCSAYAKALMSGIMSTGVSVWDLGVSHERAADFASITLRADIYAVLSANPSPRLMLKCPGGLRIKRDMEASIEHRLKTRVFRLADISAFGEYVFCGGLSEMYVSNLKTVLPQRLNGINVSVKTSNEKTAQEADRLITPINDIDGEEIVFHILDNAHKVTAYSEKTGYVVFERLVLLCTKIHLENNEDTAIPFTFPSVFDDLARDYSAKLYRYFSSSCSHADDKARELASRESNSYVHDGMYLIADILSYLTKEKISLSEALEKLPEFYASERFLALGDKRETDSFWSEIKSKYKRSDEGIVINENKARAVIKPVSKGKGLMLYVDSEKAETAQAMCDSIEKKLKGYV